MNFLRYFSCITLLIFSLCVTSVANENETLFVAESSTNPGDMVLVDDVLYGCLKNNKTGSLEVRKLVGGKFELIKEFPQSKACKFISSTEGKTFLLFDTKTGSETINQIAIYEWKGGLAYELAFSPLFEKPISAISEIKEVIFEDKNILIPVRQTEDAAMGVYSWSLLASSHFGKNWTVVPFEVDGEKVSDIRSLVVGPNGNWLMSLVTDKAGRILSSNDKGKGWTPIFEATDAKFINLDVPRNGVLVGLLHFFVGDGAQKVRKNQLIISLDGGNSFSKKDIPQIHPDLAQNNFVVSLSASGMVVVGGGQWSKSSSGGENYLMYSLYSTGDFGATWTPVDLYEGPDVPGRLCDIHSIEVDEANGFIYSMGHEVQIQERDIGLLRRSSL